jgi:O-antigen/teichoic acid export membrane protein
MRRSHILLRNILSNFSAQGWLSLISFFATPIIYKNLGAPKYGLLALLGTIPSYLSVLDLGILSSTVKYVSELKAKKKSFSNLLSTSFISYFCLTLILALSIYLLSDILVNKIFNIPSSLQKTALTTIRLVSISFIFLSLTNFFGSILQSIQRFDLFNFKNLLAGTTIPVGTIIILLNKGGLIEVFYLHLIINLLVMSVFYFIVRKQLFKNFIISSFSFKQFKKILSFGKFKFISNINARIVFQSNQFLIAYFLPIEMVTYYSIPASILQKITSFLPNITTPIFPLASELSSLSLTKKVKSLYKKSVKISNLFIIPLIVFIFFFAKPILATWIDKDFSNKSYLVLQLLSIAYLMASFPAIIVSIIEGIGRPKIPTIFSSINVVLYLSLVFLLIPRYALIGAAISVLINRLITTPIFIFYSTKKVINIKSKFHYFNAYLKPFLLSFISLFPFLFFFESLNNLWQVMLIFIIYTLLFIFLSKLTDLINKKDIQIIREFSNSFIKNELPQIRKHKVS